MSNDWNNFMQSKPIRIILYTVCVVFSGFYAIDAAMELVSPHEQSLMLIEQIGQTGFMAMTVARLLVCAWAAFSFARLTYKIFKGEE